MRRLLRWGFYSLVLLVVVVAGMLAWIGGTESGLRFVLALVPGLETGTVQGRLFERVELRQVRYQQNGGVDLKLDAAVFAWHPAELWSRRVHVAELRAGGIEVILPPAAQADTPKEKPQVPEIELPVDLRIDQVQVDKLRIRQGEQEHRIDLVALRNAVGARDKAQVTVEALTVAAPQGELAARDVQWGLRAPHAFGLHVEAGFTHPRTGEIHSAADLRGDLQNLHAVVEGGLLPRETMPQIRLDARIQDPLDDLRWQVQVELGQVDTVNLRDLFGELPPLQGSAQLAAEGDLRQLKTRGAVHVDSAEYGPLSLDLDIAGTHPHWQIHELRLSRDDTPLQLVLRGEADASNPKQPQIDAKLNWADLRWPLRGEQTVAELPTGEFQLAGTPEAYRIHLDSAVQGGKLPPGRWQVRGEGNLQQLHIEQLHADLLDGTLDAHGNVAWQPELQADFELHGAGLRATPYWPEWPQTLSARIDLTGGIREGRFELTTLDLALPESGAQLTGSAGGALDASELEAALAWQE